MTTTIDAQGLSCPQPVLMTLSAIKKETGTTMVVLVDTEAARENVSRAVISQGWKVSGMTQEGETCRIEIARG